MEKQTKVKNAKRLIGTLLLAAVLALPALIPHVSRAATLDQLRAQSSSLQQQIDTNNQKARELASQADTLENHLAELNLQISQLQAQIELTKTKIAELQAKLDQAQKELDRQKGLLKASLQALYKKGDASTVELLIGSDSFSEFINNETYLERLKTGIQDSAEKVITLKQQIQSQKAQQQQLLDQQQSQQTSLKSTQDEQQNLLNQTKGQEATYQQTIKNLRAQQDAINREIIARSRVITGSDGGYPYRSVGFGGYYDCPGFDPWGMCKRSCTSYVAWKVASTGRYMPAWGYGEGGGNGIARYWTSSAQNAGIATGRTPRVGAVANWTYYPYGHVAYVEAVNGDGSVVVSEYNYVSPGNFDERLITPGVSLMPDSYIYF